MDSMKGIISAFMLDIDNYLLFCKEYEKPSYKYFNFVIKKMGLLCIFEAKHNLFHTSNNTFRFVDGIFIELKNKFLAEEETIKRAALIFFMGKIYLTDDVAHSLRLRITADEWNVFSSYIDLTKREPKYLPTFIMINYLNAEKFFRFTVKNKSLALDYGSSDGNEVASNIDLSRDNVFWDELKRDVEILEKCDVVELNQLKSIHDELMKPYEELLPKSNALDEALELFNEIKNIINEPQFKPANNLSRREIAAACDEFLKPSTSQISDNKSSQFFSDDEDLSDFDLENLDSVFKKSKKKTRNSQNYKKKPGRRKQEIQEQRVDAGRMEVEINSSDSDGNTETSRKTMSSIRQSVMKGVGVEKYSEKLKRCYDD